MKRVIVYHLNLAFYHELTKIIAITILEFYSLLYFIIKSFFNFYYKSFLLY